MLFSIGNLVSHRTTSFMKCQGMVPLVGERGVKKNLNYDDDIMAEPFTK